jgi:hypothetical protein
LGVRYVLEGSVRKARGRVRITAQLVDALTSTHLWADRFDGSLEDVFELQDKVASSVADVIEPALQTAETARSVWPPDKRPDCLRPLPARLCDGLVVGNANSRGAPSDGAGHRARSALRACTRFGRVLLCSAPPGRSERRSGGGLKGAGFARRALEVACDDPGILANAAPALAYLGEESAR